MSRIKELRQKKADLTTALSNIIDNPEGENGYLSEAQEKIYQAKEAELELVSKDLTRSEKQRDRELELESSIGYQSSPNNTVRVQVGDDLATKRPWNGLGEMLQAVACASSPRGGKVAGGGIVDPRLYPQAASGLQNSVPSEGGFLVQTDYTADLLNKGYETSILASRCKRIPIGEGSDSLDAPFIDETSRVNGSRWGGVRVYRAKEADSVTATKPKFGKMELKLEDLKGLCYVSERLLRDSTSLEAIVQQSFAEEFGFKVDDEIVNGSGVGEALGILNADALVTVAKESGQASATVLFQNITKMRSRLFAKSRANSVWYINQDIEPQLQSMSITVGSGGMPVYLPAGGIADDGYDRLFGRPVIPIEQCATLGTVGDIILADLSQYLLIDKDGLQAASSMHVRFIYDEMTFKFNYRINGTPIWKSTLTPYKGSNTLSPYVALQTR